MKVVRVERQTDGEASALLVHGNDLCGEFYAPLAQLLAARGIAVSLVTLPGFHDQPPYEAPTWARYAEDIAAHTRALDGSVRVLIGHSMGGFMAFLAAVDLGADVDRLVLIEPAIYPRRFMAKAASRAYLDRVVHGSRDEFVNSTGVMPRIHDVDRFPREMIELYMRVRQSSHVPSVSALFRELPELYPLPFRSLAAPTLLLSGGNIGMRGRLLAGMVRRRLGRVSHHVIAGAAHWVANEQDAAVCERIAEFVC